MARLNRAVAGRAVAARAYRFLDEMLGLEEVLFARIEREFIDAAPAVRDAVTTTADADLSARTRDALVTTTSTTLERVLAASSKHFAAFMDEALDMTQDAIHDELILCEQTLAARYKGTTAEALADLGADVRRDVAVLALDEQAPATVLWIAQTLETEMKTAATREEDEANVAARLFAPSALRAPGHTGRGLWWRAYSTVTRNARTFQFTQVNGLRNDAIAAFNRVGEER